MFQLQITLNINLLNVFISGVSREVLVSVLEVKDPVIVGFPVSSITRYYLSVSTDSWIVTKVSYVSVLTSEDQMTSFLLV